MATKKTVSRQSLALSRYHSLSNKPTPAMQDYLQILFNDCGFNREQRNDFISRRAGRHLLFLDELTIDEAHESIDELKALKERKNEARRNSES